MSSMDFQHQHTSIWSGSSRFNSVFSSHKARHFFVCLDANQTSYPPSKPTVNPSTPIFQWLVCEGAMQIESQDSTLYQLKWIEEYSAYTRSPRGSL